MVALPTDVGRASSFNRCCTLQWVTLTFGQCFQRHTPNLGHNRQLIKLRNVWVYFSFCHIVIIFVNFYFFAPCIMMGCWRCTTGTVQCQRQRTVLTKHWNNQEHSSYPLHSFLKEENLISHILTSLPSSASATITHLLIVSAALTFVTLEELDGVNESS